MIHFDNAAHASVICRLAPTTFHPGVDRCISRDEGGRFLGGAILTDYTGYGGSICIHTAGPGRNWLSRDLLWVVFDYAFRQLGCRRALVQVSSKNEKSLHFTDRLGFKNPIVIPGVFSDADLVVKSLEAADCRWTRLKPRGLRAGGI